MALGAVQALREGRGARKKLVIVGFDAVPEAVAAVNAGAMTATAQQQPQDIGRAALDVAIKLANGQTVPPDTVVRRCVW